MRATGIIRRIDELGRVVIPKVVRELAELSENDPMEIFYGKYDAEDGKRRTEIILRLYLPEQERNNETD